VSYPTFYETICAIDKKRAKIYFYQNDLGSEELFGNVTLVLAWIRKQITSKLLDQKLSSLSNRNHLIFSTKGTFFPYVAFTCGVLVCKERISFKPSVSNSNHLRCLGLTYNKPWLLIKTNVGVAQIHIVTKDTCGTFGKNLPSMRRRASILLGPLLCWV